MTSYTLSPVWGAGAQLFDNSGNVLTGGKIETYEAGTTTPAATYTDPIGSTFNSNPIIADASGRLSNEIWLSVGTAYKFVLKDANNVLIATYDNIPSSPQPPINNDASAISYEQGYTVTAGAFTVGATYLITSVGTTNFVAIGAAANVTGILFTATGVGSGTGTAKYSRTVQAKLQESVSVKDFGATGDGVTDDTVAIQNAITAVGLGGTVIIPTGTYVISSTINPSNINFIGNGYSTVIKPTAAVTTAISLNSTAYDLIAGVSWNTTIKNIFIDGSSTTNATGLLIGSTPTSGNYLISNIEVNLFAGGSGVGIQLAEAIHVKVENSSITRCDIGTYVFAPVAPTNPTTSTFNNCHFVSNNEQGVLLKSGYQVTFLNCIFEGNKGEGFKAFPAAGIPSLLLSLENCWFEANQVGRPSITSLYSCVMDGTLADTFSFQMSNVQFTITNTSEKALFIDTVYSSSIKEIETVNVIDSITVQNVINNGLVFISYPTNYDFVTNVDNVDNSQIVFLPESYTGTGSIFAPTVTGTGGMVFTPTNFVNNNFVTVQKNTTYGNDTKQCTVHLNFTGTTSVTSSASFDVSLPAGIVPANSTEFTTAIVLDNSVQSIGLIKTNGASGLTVAKLNSTGFSLNPNCGVQCTFTFNIL